MNYWDASSGTANCQLMDGVEPQENVSGYKLIGEQ